ncbi:hypothetical protein [Sorangium sp. So ce124]|uniref:hypothetical protein n=1 Tax=Sorangium sp. So ce124 TaxID=3133280 RepID=UPI003F6276CF
MITREIVELMEEEQLLDWLLRRMRAEEADPPLSTLHAETPDDYVAVIHGQTTDLTFRERLERAVVTGLEMSGASDVLTTRDAEAVRNLAELALRRRISAAAPVLRRIAERGAFGGRARGLVEIVERSVLFALAGLQERKLLWENWLSLWRQGAPVPWPIIVAGLRLSNPSKATELLPEIVERALSGGRFPLGEVLWAFGTDPVIDAGQIAKALSGLSPEAVARCRRDLEEIGALAEELDAWLPPAVPSVHPTWARRGHLPRKPPSMIRAITEAA